MSLVTGSAYVLSSHGWAALTAQHWPAITEQPGEREQPAGACAG